MKGQEAWTLREGMGEVGPFTPSHPEVRERWDEMVFAKHIDSMFMQTFEECCSG